MEPSLAAEISVRTRVSDGLLLEHYSYTSGKVEPILKHSHEDYQFALSFDHQGEYTYRGELHQIPPARLSVVHSGEVHAPSDRTYLSEPAHFSMAHIHPKWLNAVAFEMLEQPSSDPFFPTVLPQDSCLNQLFLDFSAIDKRASLLEQETALWRFLSYLIVRYARDFPSAKTLSSSRAAVCRARDYLHARFDENVSLAELAAVAGLSRFHFCRLFRREFGVSASLYQTHLRIARARKLLAEGKTISEVAIATGFYDQSHFGKHFKRHVGTTPAKYTC